MVEIRTGYGVYENPGMVFDDPSRAKQSFKDECDINNILSKWQETGLVTHVRPDPGVYDDMTVKPEDYHAGMNLVVQAQEAFMELPSTVRKRFGNDPALFLAGIAQEENREFLEEHGLLEPRPEVEPPSGVDPVPPGPAPAPAAGQEGGAAATT